ncbi:MAG: GIY-YIG nuclease family protein [Alphaproteobacteria bacterium]|nr:GIY-YIG nuclease family protein [Alphaproteobacteria bacterium]
MEEIRPAHENITKDLTTKSAKIRALAQAGYNRTEISKILGIRYQHVRNVLVDADIKVGKKSTSDELTITIPLAKKERKPVPSKFLLDKGFQDIGEWHLTEKRTLAMSAKAPREQGVYALILDDIIVYIGLTLNGLQTRMDQYRRGHKGQRTSARVNKLIVTSLTKGHQVKILVATPPASEWSGLPVNTAAGLEVGLIDLIRPAWNIRGNS